MLPAFSDSLPSEFHHKALSPHEIHHIMRSRDLFLLVYLLGSGFGESRFCVLSLRRSMSVEIQSKLNPPLKHKTGDKNSVKDQNQQRISPANKSIRSLLWLIPLCRGALPLSKKLLTNISSSHSVALGDALLQYDELVMSHAPSCCH